MSVLSKHDIQRSIGYGGIGATRGGGKKLAIEPASMDLHLGDEFAKLQPGEEDREVVVDDEETYPEWSVSDVSGTKPARIFPNEFVLATTEETVDLPSGLVGLIHGRSSVGRLGLFVHNAGFCDPGYTGEVTLELYNASPYAITLKPGMRICQLSLHETKTEPRVAYSEENGNKYDGQTGPTPSKLWEDFE